MVLFSGWLSEYYRLKIVLLAPKGLFGPKFHVKEVAPTVEPPTTVLLVRKLL